MLLVMLAAGTATGYGLMVSRGTPAASDAEALLMIPAAHLDLGTVWEQRGLSITLPLCNRSGNDIYIEQVRADCNCSSVSPSEFVLPARGKREITLQVNLRIDADIPPNAPIPSSGVGVEVTPFSLNILAGGFIGSPNGKPVIASWRMTGMVKPHLLVPSKRSVDFGDLLVKGQRIPASRLEVAAAAEISNIRADFRGSGFTAVVRKLPSSVQHRFEVVVEAKPTVITTDYEDELSLTPEFAPDSPLAILDLPPMAIPVSANLVADVFVEPAPLHLGVSEEGARLSGIVCLSSRSGKPFDIVRVEAPPPIELAPSEVGLGESMRAYLVTTVVQRSGLVRSDVCFWVRDCDGGTEEYQIRLPVACQCVEQKGHFP
jgi:hypothetical protein